jgi:hypothetical protein
VRTSFLLTAFVLVAVLLPGCAQTVTQTLQSNFAADQDAALAVANATGDTDMQICASKLDAIAKVQCPLVSTTPGGPGVAGPACTATKAYEAEQAVVHSCSAVEANAKSGFVTILSSLGIIP